MRDSAESWGRLPGSKQASVALWTRTDPLPVPDAMTVLPYGQGRSYGDSCLNSLGVVLSTRRLNRFMAFDPIAGTITCEAGTTLAEIIDVCLPKGWFLPVVPGTQYVSVGGAIANDVHGKNHHCAGTFGNHVVRFELLRSDGSRWPCSEQDHPDWFRATIGGLGLTGLITWAEVKLRSVASALVEVEDIPFSSLEEFLAASGDSDRDFEYTVAWFDCFSYADGKLRGIFSRARHVEAADGTLAGSRPLPRLSLPLELPGWVLCATSVKLFNALYHRAKRARGKRRVRLEAFLFPLDAIAHWNRLYGRQGFMQLQCAFPEATGAAGVSRLLQTIARQRQGSFLSVLKRFGAKASPGLLSFPLPGVTVALDFRNRGAATRALLADCHAIIVAHGGRVYPAKDACMDPRVFAAGYPAWRSLVPYIDPRFSSDFWRRTAGALGTEGTSG
ncbi:MAG TPA: FAD-binding oxidoreductase [Casimicrobiaceae bacterium]